MYDRAYHEANRERINQKHRENYLKHREERNARRRAEYQLQRERILQKQKEDRAPCPLAPGTVRASKQIAKGSGVDK